MLFMEKTKRKHIENKGLRRNKPKKRTGELWGEEQTRKLQAIHNKVVNYDY